MIFLFPLDAINHLFSLESHTLIKMGRLALLFQNQYNYRPRESINESKTKLYYKNLQLFACAIFAIAFGYCKIGGAAGTFKIK